MPSGAGVNERLDLDGIAGAFLDPEPARAAGGHSVCPRGGTDLRHDPAGSSNLVGIEGLYATPLPAKRTGPLYSACSYPTKISPESIAIFLASHTRPGDTVLDVFAGSGTTGLAGLLCARPTDDVLALAEQLKAPVEWGPRNVILQEIGVWGSFVARVMCNPPDPSRFLLAAQRMLSAAEDQLAGIYAVSDPEGQAGILRHAIWSDVLICPSCTYESAFWDAAVRFSPLALAPTCSCPACGEQVVVGRADRAVETYFDPLLGTEAERRKRVLKRIYGRTSERRWWRDATPQDQELVREVADLPLPSAVPIAKIPWGDLYRAGYHRGLTHLHHFYTPRNFLVMATLWEQANREPEDLRDALRLLLLSYNTTHSTLMTRVVVKREQQDFVVTSAQSGVLYVSSLPVEKNIFAGVRRKSATLASAFQIVRGSTAAVQVVRGSSTKLDLPDQSVDYVFTDPPFGDYIPYAEINFLNEAWLGATTDSTEEAIVSAAQKKTVASYGALLGAVFAEVSRVLKADGKATIVFHSAKASMWSALQEAYSSAGLRVALSGVLDKHQTSFKQSNAEVRVKGDPLLLLIKQAQGMAINTIPAGPDSVIAELWTRARRLGDSKERTPERLYSRFVTRYLEHGAPVPLDAGHFYARLHALQEKAP